jgi:hypothetical protein
MLPALRHHFFRCAKIDLFLDSSTQSESRRGWLEFSFTTTPLLLHFGSLAAA